MPAPHKSYQREAVGPLDGVRILDLSRLVAGNVLTQLLADFGAEVIKVEPADGDVLRSWRTKGVSTYWKLFCRNKKSLAMDFRAPNALDLLRKLVPSAHVFVESFRPGTLEAMDMSPAALHEINPKLVIIRISGWGQDGPYARRPGFGTLVEGMSGFAAMNGFPDREPVLPPFYLADAFAGLYGAVGLMIALREAQKDGGRGEVIDVPLLDPLFHMLGPHAANYQLTGKPRPRTGSRSTNAAPRNTYRCSDGRWVSLSATTQKMADRLFNAMGRPEVLQDPRFRTNADRVENVEALDAIIGEFMAQRTQAENVELFDRCDVTVGPIYDIEQVMADPHFLARGLFAAYPDAEMDSFPMTPVAPRMTAKPGAIRSGAPTLGQHNREILREIGIDDAAYDALLAQRTVVEESPPQARGKRP
jgi:formyl-CoA transferase